jgi:hypothetical protein
MPHYTEGTYDNVEVTGQAFVKSSAKGTPGFELTILPGEFPRKVTFWLPDGNELSVDIMLRSLEAMGLDLSGVERFSQFDSRSSQHVSFVGQNVSVVCEYESANGKTYERWSAPYTPTAKVAETLDVASIRKLDAMFGKKLKGRMPPAPKPEAKPAEATGVNKSQVAQARAANEQAAEPGADPEIPF